MGPVSHLEFKKAWAPYYDYKGTEWMEAKKVEMNQSLEQGVLEKWVERMENYNVYHYYLSRNEIPSQLQDDRFFVTLDPNFVNPEPIEPVLTREQLADAIIDCIKGYKQVGSECVSDDTLTISYGHQWILKIILIIVIVGGIIIGVVFGRKFWRKRN